MGPHQATSSGTEDSPEDCRKGGHKTKGDKKVDPETVQIQAGPWLRCVASSLCSGYFWAELSDRNKHKSSSVRNGHLESPQMIFQAMSSPQSSHSTCMEIKHHKQEPAETTEQKQIRKVFDRWTRQSQIRIWVFPYFPKAQIIALGFHKRPTVVQ